MEESKIVNEIASLRTKFLVPRRGTTLEYDYLFNPDGIGTLAADYCDALDSSLDQATAYLYGISDKKPIIPTLNQKKRIEIEKETADFHIAFFQNRASNVTKNYGFIRYLIDAKASEILERDSLKGVLQKTEFDYSLELLDIFFLSLHPNIHPDTKLLISESDTAEIEIITDRFLSFKSQSTSFSEMIWEFIAYIQSNPIERITSAHVVSQEIIQLSSIIPEKHMIPNNKFANNLVNMYADEKYELVVSPEKSKKEIITSCILTYVGDNVKLIGQKTFTEYDRNVYNAITSLYVYGHSSHKMTTAMIYRAMTGQKNTENPSRTQLKKIEDSIEKMRHINVTLDCTEEFRARNVTLDGEKIEEGILDTYLLLIEKIRVTAGGQKKFAYRVMQAPFLLEYSSSVKQVLTIPSSLLDIKELDKGGKPTSRSISNTDTRIVIKGYLLRRIEGMKGKNQLHSNIISLLDYKKNGKERPGLYSIAGATNASKVEAQRIRKATENMLAYWKAVGYINDYKPIVKNKQINGYQITV